MTLAGVYGYNFNDIHAYVNNLNSSGAVNNPSCITLTPAKTSTTTGKKPKTKTSTCTASTGAPAKSAGILYANSVAIDQSAHNLTITFPSLQNSGLALSENSKLSLYFKNGVPCNSLTTSVNDDNYYCFEQQYDVTSHLLNLPSNPAGSATATPDYIITVPAKTIVESKGIGSITAELDKIIPTAVDSIALKVDGGEIVSIFDAANNPYVTDSDNTIIFVSSSVAPTPTPPNYALPSKLLKLNYSFRNLTPGTPLTFTATGSLKGVKKPVKTNSVAVAWEK